MLTARTQRPLVAPQELGPLAPVIDRAGRLDPDDRYPDAGNDAPGARRRGRDAAAAGPARARGHGRPRRSAPDPRSRRRAKPPLFDQDAADAPPPLAAPPVTATRPSRSRYVEPRRLVPFVVAFVIIAVVALAASAFARVGGATTISVPGFIGRTRDQAVHAREGQRAARRRVRAQSSPDPTGIVFGQSPDTGAWTSDRVVQLSGVVGARQAVRSHRSSASRGRTRRRSSTQIGFDYALAAEYNRTVPGRRGDPRDAARRDGPGSTKLAPDAKIVVVVSKGHAPVPVPDVTNMAYADAVQALADAGFKPAARPRPVQRPDSAQQGRVDGTGHRHRGAVPVDRRDPDVARAGHGEGPERPRALRVCGRHRAEREGPGVGRPWARSAVRES